MRTLAGSCLGEVAGLAGYAGVVLGSCELGLAGSMSPFCHPKPGVVLIIAAAGSYGGAMTVDLLDGARGNHAAAILGSLIGVAAAGLPAPARAPAGLPRAAADRGRVGPRVLERLRAARLRRPARRRGTSPCRGTRRRATST